MISISLPSVSLLLVSGLITCAVGVLIIVGANVLKRKQDGFSPVLLTVMNVLGAVCALGGVGLLSMALLIWYGVKSAWF